jgi:hypothetical protein
MSAWRWTGSLIDFSWGGGALDIRNEVVAADVLVQRCGRLHCDLSLGGNRAHGRQAEQRDRAEAVAS